jgi:hypothetical protein
MSTGIIIIILIVVIVVVAGGAIMYNARRRRLQQRFGPEYDRMVEEKGSRTKAEAELTGRQRRVASLDIRPLDATARARYTQNWAAIQEQFVDAPQEAVAAAQRLVMTVMNERGYPTEGDDQMLADLSVEHATVLDNYRAAYVISQRAADGMASTEELRQAMIHYRTLFQELLGTGTAATDTAATDTTATGTTETPAGLPAEQVPAAGNGPGTAVGNGPGTAVGTGTGTGVGTGVGNGTGTGVGTGVGTTPTAEATEPDLPPQRRS